MNSSNDPMSPQISTEELRPDLDSGSAEASARQLVESIQAIVWRGDETYQFTFVSKEAELLLGYPARRWLTEPHFWAQHIHPEDRDWVVSYGIESASQKRDHSYDFRMIAGDGRTVWFRNVVRVLALEGHPRELVGVMIDITRQKESEDQLRKSREQLRALSAHLQYVREEERTRIAREIHDELGQVLTALKMDLSLLNRGLLESSETMPRFKLMEEIGSMRRLVDRTIQTVRRIATELRPEVLDYLDLKAAMEWQIQEFQTRSGIICEFRCNVDIIELDRDRATALFRIFQEAMTNVARHSNASRVNIGLLAKQGSLLMEISDNGRGITEGEIAKARSFGLLGMKERALLLGGEMEIKGVPAQGTTLTVRISVEDTEVKGG
jgi:PAS domain S-box-containing protein